MSDLPVKRGVYVSASVILCLIDFIWAPKVVGDAVAGVTSLWLQSEILQNCPPLESVGLLGSLV